MATFFTDADLAGAAQFVEFELVIGTRFTIETGLVVPRWRWPNNAPGVTPMVRVYDTGGALVAGPIAFDSTALTSWNTAGSASPLALPAGTYDFTVNTTHYMAVAGFFAGGPITRGAITGVQARFGNVGQAPPNGATATYYMDIDWTAGTGPLPAVYPGSLALAVALGQPAITTPPKPAPEATPGGWSGYGAVLASARADHAANLERARHPVECPVDGWPLRTTRHGMYCEFGGHIVAGEGSAGI